MRTVRRSLSRVPITTLVIGLAAVGLGIVLPGSDAPRPIVLLLGTWLVFGALIMAAGSDAAQGAEGNRWIPVRFSGHLGRFEVRPRGDGRRVEVRAGAEVVAQLVATDAGDELVVDFDLADAPDVDAFGAAIGRAIEMVALADDGGPAHRQPAGPPTSAGLLGVRRDPPAVAEGR